MKRLLITSSLLAFAAACTGSVETSPSGGTTSGTSSTTSTGTGAGGGGVPSDVNGTVIYTYYADGSQSDVPADLNGVAITAYTQQGNQWTGIPGMGHADGSFTIPQVPAGMYMLDVGGSYLYTSARKLDLGSSIGGRAGAAFANPSSQIAGDMQNLAPWQTSDAVEFFDANSGGEGYGYSQGGPATGATSLNGEPAAWYGALVDASAGDTLYVSQLSIQTSGNVYFETVVRFATITGVQQNDGALTTVMGQFTSVTQDQTTSVDFHATQFDKLASSVNPKAMSYGAVYELFTAPGAATAGELGYLADLLDVYPGSSDAQLSGVKYGNPFPSAWGTLVYAGESWSVSYTAKGATQPGTQYGSVYVIMPVDKSQGPIVPAVGPVSSPLVDGKDAFGPLQGISTTPTISWSPPVVGKAAGYRVTVYQLDPTGGTTSLPYVTSISTTATSVPFPPNVLLAGNEYMFQITAYDSSFDADTTPFRTGTSYAAADVLTSAVSF